MPRGTPCHVEASAANTCHGPGATLLPRPVAHAISLATRSTSIAIRLGSAVTNYTLDAARFTTLSSLGLARDLVESILSRAARDTITLSTSALNEKEAETILERSLETLHSAVMQIVFWTSAGFRLTGTTVSTVSEASQLVLDSLDKLFGSTDSSRAVASIITLIRRELSQPPTGLGGEKVGVADLVIALGALAYLQRASRRSASEEARRQSFEEVIWDVVVLSDGERVDVGSVRPDKNNDNNNNNNNNSSSSTRGLLPNDDYAVHDDDEAVLARLKSHITSNLDPGTTISVTNSVASVQTITVNVDGPQLLSLPTPPGAEIVETRRPAHTPGDSQSWNCGSDKENSYTVVYRIRRDRLRTVTFRGEEEDSVPTVVEIVDDPAVKPAEIAASNTPLQPEHLTSQDLVAKRARRPASTPSGSATPRIGSRINKPNVEPNSKSPPSQNRAAKLEPAANQKRQRTPQVAPPGRTSSFQKLLPADPGRRPLSKKKAEAPSSATAKGSEKKPGFKRVLRESSQSLSNMWNRESSDTDQNRVSLKQRPQWKGVGGSISAADFSTRFKAAGVRTHQPQFQRNNAPAKRIQTPEPFASPSSSRASYVSIHERRQDSIVSQADSYGRKSATGGLPPSSPTIFRTDYSTQETISRAAGEPLAPGLTPELPRSKDVHPHRRRSASYAPSLYSLATNDSQSSVILASYYQKSAYNASGALNILRNEGFVDGTFPTGHLLPNIVRYMRHSSACYGSHFMKILGISKELPAQQAWNGVHQDVRHFAHHTESRDGNILLASFVDPQGGSDATGSTGTGVPLVHYISLDHEAKAVVLACRGTLGFEDVLADLTCDYDSLSWRGREYRVHKGVHASARRLLLGDDGRVLVTLREALLEFPDYGLVLCGHSLGGGVTSLLGVMLAEPNPDGPGFVISAEPQSRLVTRGEVGAAEHKLRDVRLPQGRRIHVYAYGPPGIMSSSLRNITRGLITTVVHGNDIVPHLSLGVLHDFQSLAVSFKKDENRTRQEIRRRMWQALQDHLADKWYQTVPVTPREGDEEWVLPVLQALRGSMRGKKLVPPGEVFAIETTRVLRRDAFVAHDDDGDDGAIGRPARRVVLKYVRDVEGRFREVRFGAGLLTDHSPAKYEDALNKLRLGVVE
ncbi:hypothetical protein UVI_02015170 [Ustilaginoidea virens]|uniref:sn-1-specific diacylglycerol lipase n=1 Tax=Ustilaginoidea virens TaxID=1159556 RepID=A0A1B5L8B3_USTVR|nr:hypothetical protein UVI_02015170 [Ustilaginoidea virens]